MNNTTSLLLLVVPRKARDVLAAEIILLLVDPLEEAAPLLYERIVGLVRHRDALAQQREVVVVEQHVAVQPVDRLGGFG